MQRLLSKNPIPVACAEDSQTPSRQRVGATAIDLQPKHGAARWWKSTFHCISWGPAVWLVGLATLLPTGCVHRRLTVRTDPPGAQVSVDGVAAGYSPTSIDFTYYGTRELTLVKPGYETLTVFQKIPAPWYQIPPFDFFADNLLPFQVTNRHDFTYQLQPKVVVSSGELLDRANALRAEAQMGP